MDSAGIIWILFVLAMAVVPPLIESRLKKAAGKGNAMPVASSEEEEDPQPQRRAVVQRPLPSEVRPAVQPLPSAARVEKKPLDSIPQEEGECAVSHPEKTVPAGTGEPPLELDLEKMIIYSEILRPKFED